MYKYNIEVGMTIYQMVEVEAEDDYNAAYAATEIMAERLGVPMPAVEECNFDIFTKEEIEEDE